tara:strand:+ start:1535 stop:4699 length:3165 start_codon:yes stop_codon:yes gene_type:complete
MFKAYNEVDELDKDTLASDDDFIADAVTFLENRGGLSGEMTREEVYENFMEHMRYHDVNEVTTIRDLEYAQNADASGKEGFARLIDAYDKVNDTDTGRMLGDYAMGLLTAPSTYIGLISGGTGKAAAVAGTQAAKLGVRKILGDVGRSAVRAAVPEAVIGTGQGAAQEFTRVTTGQQEEFTGGRTVTTGVASGIGGALIGGGASALGSLTGKGALSRASSANELMEAAKIGAAKKAQVAARKSKEVLETADSETVKKVREKLNELDPARVMEGRRLKKDLNPSDTLEASLGSDVFKNIMAAAIQVQSRLDIKPGDRITTAMYTAMKEGKLEDLGISNILREHNLNMDQFSLVYLAEVSEAGRTLGIQGRLSKELKKTDAQAFAQINKLLDEVDDMNQLGVSSITRQDSADVIGNAALKAKVLQGIRDFDKAGISFMTIQPATTMRNTIGGGFRIGVDAATRTMDNAIQSFLDSTTKGYYAPKRNLFDGTFDLAKYMMNPQEGRVIRTLFEENMPEEAKRLFRDAADLSAATDTETALARVGRKVQVLNTASDNIFKQGVLAASLKRRLSDKGINLYDVIRDGSFGDIPEDIYQAAVKDAYEFTYQSGMKGDDIFSSAARGLIRANDKYPFAISAFMPFPRFVANQLKFQYQHMPIIGMLDVVINPSIARERLPKQLAGAAMLTTAYAWRLKQGDEAEWYEIHKGGDDYIDGRAIYGPMAPFMLVADMIYRAQTDNFSKLPVSFGKYYSQALLQATLGSTFRTGMGIAMLDKVFEDGIKAGNTKTVAEGLGGFLGRWTIPAGLVKDVYGQFDPRSRDIPATSTGDENFFDFMYKKATRNLPDFPLASWSADMITTEDYDTPAVSPLKSGTLRAVNPIEKQLFGATTIRKSRVMKEMSRLGMSYTDMYKRNKDDKIDFYTRLELSRAGSPNNLDEKLRAIINSDEYKNSSPAFQQQMLERAGSTIKTKAEQVAKLRIQAQARRRGLPYSRVEIAEWDNLSKKVKERINEIYQTYEGYEGRKVGEDKDMIIDIGGRRVNALQWALREALPIAKRGVQ